MSYFSSTCLKLATIFKDIIFQIPVDDGASYECVFNCIVILAELAKTELSGLYLNHKNVEHITATAKELLEISMVNEKFGGSLTRLIHDLETGFVVLSKTPLKKF